MIGIVRGTDIKGEYVEKHWLEEHKWRVVAFAILLIAAATGITANQIRTAAPTTVSVSGIAAAEGTSISMARADHAHSLTGTLPIGNGGTGLTTIGDDAVRVGDAATSSTARTLPSTSAAGLAVKYNIATNTFSASSAFSGTGSCTNQFPRTLNAEAAPTCASVADIDLVNNYSGIGACAAGSAATTLNDNAAPTCSTTVVFTDEGNTYSTGAQNFTSATSLTVPVAVGAAPTASGTIAYDSTANDLEYGDATVNRKVANLDEAQTLSSKTLTTPVISAGLTASGATSNNFSGSTGTFLTSTGATTLGSSIVWNSGATILKHLTGTISCDFDFSAAGITCQNCGASVVGAVSGDTVVLGCPDTICTSAGLLCTAWVSAADSVTARCCDVTSANPNPLAATVRFDVWKH